ncbi:hypothetical protein BKA93DRAFT_787488 [Sparassis latifolia]
MLTSSLGPCLGLFHGCHCGLCSAGGRLVCCSWCNCARRHPSDVVVVNPLPLDALQD